MVLFYYTIYLIKTVSKVCKDFFWLGALQIGGAPINRLFGHALSWENLGTCPICPKQQRTKLQTML